MELKDKKIVVLGDSITEGVGVEKEENKFTNRLARMGECTVVNCGMGGTRLAKQIHPTQPEYDNNDFTIRIDRIDGDADIVIIFGGTNDYRYGDVPMGSVYDRDPYTFCGSLHYIMTRLYERFPGKTAVIVTPIHREDEALFYPNGYLFRELKTYVQAIREMAEFYSLPLLDLYASGGIQPLIPAFHDAFCPDGIHPNDAGHEIIARKLYNFLKVL